jgi:hypothetical protein
MQSKIEQAMNIFTIFQLNGDVAARALCGAKMGGLDQRLGNPTLAHLCSASRLNQKLSGTVLRRKINGFALRKGLSLTEVVISTFLVGTLSVSSLYTSLAITQSYQSLNDQSRSSILAERYLAEILQTYYEDPMSPIFGPEPNESTSTRSDFNDVDDYHKRNESPPTSKDGTPLPGYGSDWTVSISVFPVSLSDPRNSSLADTGLKRVDITVINPKGVEYRLSGLRSRWGGKELTQVDDGSYVQWIGVTLKSEASQQELHGGTGPLNLAEIND